MSDLYLTATNCPFATGGPDGLDLTAATVLIPAGNDAQNACSPLWDSDSPWNKYVVHYTAIHIIVEAFFRTNLRAVWEQQEIGRAQ